MPITTSRATRRLRAAMRSSMAGQHDRRLADDLDPPAPEPLPQRHRAAEQHRVDEHGLAPRRPPAAASPSSAARSARRRSRCPGSSAACPRSPPKTKPARSAPTPTRPATTTPSAVAAPAAVAAPELLRAACRSAVCAVARPLGAPASAVHLSAESRRRRAPGRLRPVNLFRFVPGYETSVYEAGREPIFVALLAFLICFVLTRGYTRDRACPRLGQRQRRTASTSTTSSSGSCSRSASGDPDHRLRARRQLLRALPLRRLRVGRRARPRRVRARLPPPGRLLVGGGPLVDRRRDRRGRRRRPRAPPRRALRRRDEPRTPAAGRSLVVVLGPRRPRRRRRCSRGSSGPG